MSAMKDAALRYAARGWEVFPCHTPERNGKCSCGDPACESQGKHPRVAWKGKATTNPQTITTWWNQWPDANIGIATGERSRIIVLDIDGNEGAETVEEHGGTPQGPQAATGRGEHRFFDHPGFPVKNFVKRDGLDMRGDGGYVVAAPSHHVSGNQYHWINTTEPLPPPPVPEWLKEMIETPVEKASSLPKVTDKTSSARTLAYASVALEKELVKLSESGSGGRNNQLNESALKLGHIVGAGWLDTSVVENALLMTAVSIGLPKHEALATINSGMTAGMKEPAVLEDRPMEPRDPKFGLHIPDQRPFNKKVSKGEESVSRIDSDWLRHGVSASDLQSREFAMVNWPVANILSEGCTLLAGKPKSKKSWLALGIAIDVALGRLALGGLETKQSRVVYLDLESNQRRMQSRIRAILGSHPWPSNLHIFTEWPRGEMGLLQLEHFKEHYPDTGLVIADILQNIRPARVKNANPYDEDYEAVKPLNQWGEKHHSAVLALHHTRKAKADDVFDEISGSTGLSAGVAGMWVLGRMPNGPESILAIRGRDIVIDDDMALGWDDYTCRFTWTGSAEERSISQERRAILEMMSDSGEYSPKDLAEMLGKSVTSVNKMLTYLFADRMVEKSGYGKYTKILGRQQTYGLHIPSGKTVPTVPTVPSGKSSLNLDSSIVKFPAKSPSTLSNSDGQHTEFTSLSDASNPTLNSNSFHSVHDSIREGDVDHDNARELEVRVALAKKDFKKARRSAMVIRGRIDRLRVEQLIEDAAQKEQNNGWATPEGY